MELPAIYVALTETLLRTLSLSHEMAHLWGGVILYSIAFSVPLARRFVALPLVVVCVAEAVNERLQAAYYGSWRINDTVADLGWTLTIPAILYAGTLIFRAFWPSLNADRTPVLG
jgi:hypothetical protein